MFSNSKPQELPTFVESMKGLLQEQKQEIEKAMIGVGEYKIQPSYSDLEVPHGQWFKKNEKQRHRLLDRFMNAAVRGGQNADLANVDVSEEESMEGLVCQVEDAPSTSNPLKCTGLPEGIQFSMWDKVQRYLEDESSYTKAPGVLDYSCVLVKSTSSTRPHFVERTGVGRYKCCLMFKSTNGLCSHSLLVATLRGEIDTFVRSHSKSKNPVNYTELAQHGLPVGGKKPGSKRKASAKNTTAKIRKVLEDTDVQTKRRQASLSNSSVSDTSAASSQTPSVYSVGISAPYANIAGATVSSPTLSVQRPPPVLNASQLPVHLPTLQMQGNQMKTQVQSMPVQIQISAPSVDTQTPMQPQVPANTYTPSMHLEAPISTQTAMQPLPPPLLHQSPERSVGQPFRVVLTTSRISRCQGCRGQINHNYDQIVLQHKEHVLFQNPHTGRWQMSRDLRNTYYHARLNCVAIKHPDFTPGEIQMGAVKDSLNLSALNLLRAEFGLLI